MTNNGVTDRLPPGDALWLYIEKEDMPLHIGSVFIFDGRIAVEEVAALVESKLPLIPRYRQRVIFPPLNVGHPTWEFDPEFDIDDHIHHTRLKHGTLEELEKLTGEIYSVMMDRSRPLWDLTVVEGLEHGRTALIARVHHSMVDGVAGVALLNVMFDFDPSKHSIPRRDRFEAPPLPDAQSTLMDALLSSYSDTMQRVLAIQRAALNLTEGLIGDLSSSAVSQMARIIPELLTPVQRLPFNCRTSAPRKVAFATLSMDEINDVRHRCGAKVNDVAMQVLAGAIKRYVKLHHLGIQGRLLRVMAPVNIRRNGQSAGLGNMISILPLNIPLDMADPVEMLKLIHERTEALRCAHVPEAIILWSTCIGVTPASVQALAFGVIGNELPMPAFNMVATNVAGPAEPLYALGRKMLTYYPYVPIGAQMGCNLAFVSYAGTMFFGLSGDAASASDVGKLRDFLYQAFEELKAAVGIQVVKPKRPRSVRAARAKVKRAPTAAAPAADLPEEVAVSAAG